MDLVLLGLRLVLVAVLLVSAIAKLLDLDGSRAAVRGFGVPERFVRTLAAALPFVELGVAGLLLFGPTAIPGALAALGMFVVFTAAIANQLRQGNAPPCHCFGALSKEPVSLRTLVRNGVLIATAGVVGWLGWSDPGPGLDGLDALSPAAAWLLVLTLGAVLTGASVIAIRRVLAVSDRFEAHLDQLATALADEPGIPPSPAASRKPMGKLADLSAGSRAPAFELTTLDGRIVTQGSAAATGRRVALLLSAESCTACHSLLPEIGLWQTELWPDVDLILVGLATGDAYRTSIERHGIRAAALPDASIYNQVMTGFGVAAVPSLVEIGPDGRLSRPIAGGVDAIRKTLAQMRQRLAADQAPQPSDGLPPRPVDAPLRPTAPPIGASVPELELASTDGRPIELGTFVTRADLTLLLFWRSDCPHCRGLLPEVREWRDGLDRERIQIVAITSGSATDVAALDIADHTLSDPAHAAHDAFGAVGSPSGILLDRSGQVASALVVGSAELGIALRSIRGPLLESRPEQRKPAGIVVTAPIN